MLIKTLHRNFLAVLLVNCLLGVLALGREISIAAWFGTSRLADVYIVSLFLNDLPGNLLLGNAVFTAALPLFARQFKEGQTAEGYGLFRRIAWWILAVYGVWMLAAGVLAGQLLAAYIPDLDAESRSLARQLYYIMLPMGLFYCLYCLIGARLSAKRRFLVYSLGPVILNAVLLTALWRLGHRLGVASLAWGTTLGALMMLIVSWISLNQGKSWRLRCQGEPATIQFKTFQQLLGPALLMGVIVQAVPFSERYLGGLLPAGNIAALNYAYKLSQFPVWIFSSALALILFPEMALRGGEEARRLPHIARRGLKITLAVLLPLSLFLFLLPELLVKTLLEHRVFTSASTLLTSGVLRGYAPGIVASGVNQLLIRVFHARPDTRIPLIALAVGGLATIIGNILVVNRFGAIGMAACFSVGAWISTGCLILGLRRKLAMNQQPESRDGYGFKRAF